MESSAESAETAQEGPLKEPASQTHPTKELTGSQSSPPSSQTEESLQGRSEESEKALPNALEGSSLSHPLSASDDQGASPKVSTPDQLEGKRSRHNSAQDITSLPGSEEVPAADAVDTDPRSSAPPADSAETAGAEAGLSQAVGDRQPTVPEVHQLGNVENGDAEETQQGPEKAMDAAAQKEAESEKEGESHPTLIYLSEAAGKPVPGETSIAIAGQSAPTVEAVDVRSATPEIAGIAEAESKTPAVKCIQGSGSPQAAAVRGGGQGSPPGSFEAVFVETLDDTPQ